VKKKIVAARPEIIISAAARTPCGISFINCLFRLLRGISDYYGIAVLLKSS
jgi:hypothetical protein